MRLVGEGKEKCRMQNAKWENGVMEWWSGGSGKLSIGLRQIEGGEMDSVAEIL